MWPEVQALLRWPRALTQFLAATTVAWKSEGWVGAPRSLGTGREAQEGHSNEASGSRVRTDPVPGRSGN